jgi:hypothetical protein
MKSELTKFITDIDHEENMDRRSSLGELVDSKIREKE